MNPTRLIIMTAAAKQKNRRDAHQKYPQKSNHKYKDKKNPPTIQILNPF